MMGRHFLIMEEQHEFGAEVQAKPDGMGAKMRDDSNLCYLGILSA